MPLRAAICIVILIALPIPRAVADTSCEPNCPTITTPSQETLLVGNNREKKQLSISHGWQTWRGRGVATRVAAYILDPRVVLGPDGKPCVFIGQVEGEPGSI